jgi:hypothetical protein
MERSKVGWEMTVILFFIINSLIKKKCEMAHCREATASSSVAKVMGEVFAYFHEVAIKRHSSMWN